MPVRPALEAAGSTVESLPGEELSGARSRVRLRARNDTLDFAGDPGESILYAGLAGGIDLPYECASGTCGTCKARLVQGALDDRWPEAPGRKSLKLERGEFLMCQCAPRGDVVVELAKAVGVPHPGAMVPSAYQGRLRETRLLTPDVMSVRIELDRGCDFEAGQFMAVAIPDVNGHRAYSMVNFECGARMLHFIVRKKPGGGVSEWLFGRDRGGAAVRLFGPLGRATFDPAIDKDILCIAGGSGIAGIMSILSRACQERYFQRRRGDVFFGLRTMEDAFFLPELARFTRGFGDRLAVTVAFSNGAAPEWAARRFPELAFEEGFVHEVAQRRMRGRYQNVRAYVAGPPPAVDAALRLLLLEARLTPENIRYDKFS